MIICEKCGLSSPDSAKFCPFCGASLPEPAETLGAAQKSSEPLPEKIPLIAGENRTKKDPQTLPGFAGHLLISSPQNHLSVQDEKKRTSQRKRAANIREPERKAPLPAWMPSATPIFNPPTDAPRMEEIPTATEPIWTTRKYDPADENDELNLDDLNER